MIIVARYPQYIIKLQNYFGAIMEYLPTFETLRLQ